MNVEKELKEIKEMLTALYNKVPVDNTSSEPYKDYILRWFNTYKLPKNGVNTSKFMLLYITVRIIPALGDIPLNKLSGDQIQSFLNGIEKNNTRQKVAMIINGSLTKAVKLRLIKYNPFDAVELATYKKKHYRPIYLEEQALMVFSEKNSLYASVFRVLVCTGMRIGEFLAIDSGCIDYTERYINVWRGIDIRSGDLQNRTKTYTSVRRIPFLRTLSPHLKIICQYIGSHGFMTYNQVKLHFQRFYKTLKLKGLTLHSCRHTFGCMCYHAGINDKTIQHIMGHADLNVTMNIYVDILGNGNSPFIKYFEEYKNDLLKRPADFWVFSAPEK